MNLSTARTILLEHAKLLTNIGRLTVENDNYEAKNREPWARFTFTPVETSILTVGQDPSLRIGGLATIQLFEPVGVGAASLFTKADAVIAHFKTASRLGTSPDIVHIEKSFGSNTIDGPSFSRLNVYVRWYAFTRDA